MVVDFSDLNKLLDRAALQAQFKDCPYCGKRMKKILLEDLSTQDQKVSFRCLNCGYKTDLGDSNLGND